MYLSLNDEPLPIHVAGKPFLASPSFLPQQAWATKPWSHKCDRGYVIQDLDSCYVQITSHNVFDIPSHP